MTEVEREQLAQIRKKRSLLKSESKMAKTPNHPIMPRTAGPPRTSNAPVHVLMQH